MSFPIFNQPCAIDLHLTDFWGFKAMIDIDLWDAHLDLLDTDIDSFPSKHFFDLQYALKTCLEDVFNVTVYCLARHFSRRPEDVLKTP